MRIGRKEGWFQGIKNRFRQGFQLVPQPDEGEEIKRRFYLWDGGVSQGEEKAAKELLGVKRATFQEGNLALCIESI